jgi:hypothetical protein
MPTKLGWRSYEVRENPGFRKNLDYDYDNDNESYSHSSAQAFVNGFVQLIQ